MAFTQSTLLGQPVVTFSANGMKVAWTPNPGLPLNTTWQLYLNGSLAWSGTANVVRLPQPRYAVQVEVGSVGPGESRVDFSSFLPLLPYANQASLTFTGDASHSKYLIYLSAPGDAVVTTGKPFATLTAYGATLHTWQSPPLPAGVYQLVVVPVDAHGVAGTVGVVQTVTLTGPPAPPTPLPTGQRVAGKVAGNQVILTWGS